MKVPDWYQLVLLGAAAWRTFQLVAEDDLLDRPRRHLLRLGSKWQKEGDEVPNDYRFKWAQFLTCPYCTGLYLSLGIYLFWVWLPTPTLVVSTVFALNAGVIALAKVLSKEE